jgi:hypothetical protein
MATVTLRSSSGERTFATIQEAINAASAGDTIIVSGDINEIITVDKEVTIRGDDATLTGGIYITAAGVTVEDLEIVTTSALVGGEPAAIHVNANNVTLDDLTIIDGASSRVGVTTPAGITGLTLSDSTISGFVQGAYFNPGTQFTASGNTFRDNFVGIAGDDWAAGTQISGNRFEDGGNIGYGVISGSANPDAFIGANNKFEEGRPVSIFIYNFDNDEIGGEVTGTRLSDFVTGSSGEDIFIDYGNTLLTGHSHGNGKGKGHDKNADKPGHQKHHDGAVVLADNDTYIGGAGDDLFVFKRSNGHDVILDFEAGTGEGDQINLAAWGFDSFDDVTSNARFVDGRGLVIRLDDNSSITLANLTSVTQLNANDFIFAP